MPQDFTPAYLAAAVEASLRRLRTDHIDLYQLHSPPRSVVERGDYVARCSSALKAHGKIRHFGIGRGRGRRRQRLRAASRRRVAPGAVQPSPPGRRPIVLFPKPERHEFGVIARSCYAAGLFKDGLDEAALQGSPRTGREILELHRTARRARPSADGGCPAVQPRAARGRGDDPRACAPERTSRATSATTLRPALTPSELAVLMDGARGAP